MWPSRIGEKIVALDVFTSYLRQFLFYKKCIFRKWVEHVNSPVVFCHNDLQGGNILYRKDLGDNGEI